MAYQITVQVTYDNAHEAENNYLLEQFDFLVILLRLEYSQ